MMISSTSQIGKKKETGTTLFNHMFVVHHLLKALDRNIEGHVSSAFLTLTLLWIESSEFLS